MTYISVDIDIDDIISELSDLEKHELLIELQQDVGSGDGHEWLVLMARGDFEGGLLMFRRTAEGEVAHLADIAITKARDIRGSIQ